MHWTCWKTLVRWLGWSGLVLLTLVTAPSVARADQCQAVTPAQATAALMQLRPGRPFIRLCEPCGEILSPESTNVQRVMTATVSPSGDGYQSVQVNGEAVDLAYVFVRGRGGVFTNLARLSGCEASGVSTQLAVPEAQPIVTAPSTFVPPPVVVAPPPPPPPPPVVAPAPVGMVYRYPGSVATTLGVATVGPGTRCIVEVYQVTNSATNNCRVVVTCGGQTIYGRGGSGFGICGFNSVRTGIIFRGTATTITMQDRRSSTEDGDPRIDLNLPNGGVVVTDATTPVNAWSVAIRGLRAY